VMPEVGVAQGTTARGREHARRRGGRHEGLDARGPPGRWTARSGSGLARWPCRTISRYGGRRRASRHPVSLTGQGAPPATTRPSWNRVATPRSAVAAAIRRRTVRTHATPQTTNPDSGADPPRTSTAARHQAALRLIGITERFRVLYLSVRLGACTRGGANVERAASAASLPTCPAVIRLALGRHARSTATSCRS
jgi:hypothetical protein